MSDKRETADVPAKLLLRPDRTTVSADGEDISVIAVEVLDARGLLVPTAANEVTFKIAGPGRVIGVGNGDPSCHEPDKPSSGTEAKRSAFNGLAMAIAQALKRPGEIRIEAHSPGLETASTVITTQSGTLRPAI